MTVSDNAHQSIAKRNEWAEASLWLSICSILPYPIFGFVYFLETRAEVYYYQAVVVLALFCLFWGMLLGTIALITGIVSVRQIKRSQNMETGAHLATLGMVLGLVAISLDLLFAYRLFVWYMAMFFA